MKMEMSERFVREADLSTTGSLQQPSAEDNFTCLLRAFSALNCKSCHIIYTQMEVIKTRESRMGVIIIKAENSGTSHEFL